MFEETLVFPLPTSDSIKTNIKWRKSKRDARKENAMFPMKENTKDETVNHNKIRRGSVLSRESGYKR